MNIISFLPAINWVDIVVLAFLIRGGYIGLSRGFSVEFFKIIGAIVSVVLALLYYKIAGEWVADHSFLSLPTANFLSIICIVCALLFIFRLLRIFLFKVLHLEFLSVFLERSGGLILGIARSIIWASLFLFVLTLPPITYLRESVECNSFVGPCVKQVAVRLLDLVHSYIPENQ